eukprot:CAMPEP_0119265210 /NCGR_PEP_ID=MMETSP1329-20130426/4079_1 /TAXON_ID=114041 /ORGANISM="Genus nov. species nov., Strain RCC1024" /LENGTH=305 /DNA_ID=CAMNT_0007265023 /DNA_START=94 /DNA_END=1008 /DNA_ORIENTATION=-
MRPSAAAILAAAHGFLLAPTPKTPLLRRAASFHAEGDLSGDFRLSGVWKLERNPVDFERPKKTVDIHRSWSGEAYAAPNRPRVLKNSVLVTLDAAGGFRTPEQQSGEELRGKWSCDGSELTLARFDNIGNHVVETYTGVYSKSKNRVKGTMAYGASEPEYAGRFRMTPLFPELQPVVANEVRNRTMPLFRVAQVAGAWSLEFRGTEGFSAYDVRLYENRTWETVSDLGAPGARLAGKWNLFDDGIDLASGIEGRGGRLWLWLRRFGPTATKGVHLTHDRLYLGRITPVSGTDAEAPEPRRVSGQV